MDISSFESFVSKIEATGGEDTCEDVQGGLKLALMQDWTVEATKKVVFICDAPGHGSDINGGEWDDYPGGSLEGLQIKDLMLQFKERNIEFVVIKLKDYCNDMINVMKAHHPGVEV